MNIISAYSIEYVDEFFRDKPEFSECPEMGIIYVDSDHEYLSYPDAYFDRSDMAWINEEFHSGKAIIVKDISDNPKTSYTHIVKDSLGHFSAVILGEGDWTENY